MDSWQRTHHCGEIRVGHEGARVTLTGWVHRRRDHGSLVFVDLRDRYGLTQVVFNAEKSPAAHDLAHALRPEYVIGVSGTVVRRQNENVNPALATGEVEVAVEAAEILNDCQPLPFTLEDQD